MQTLQSCEFCEHSEVVDNGVACLREGAPIYSYTLRNLETLQLSPIWFPHNPDGCEWMRKVARTCAAWEPMGIKEERG